MLLRGLDGTLFSIRKAISPIRWLHKKNGSNSDMIVEDINPKVRGWLNFFRRFDPSAIMVKWTFRSLTMRIIKWAMCKYKRYRGKFLCVLE